MGDCYSNIFATISLLSWIIVFIPQAYENYQRKDASSLSVYFILLWLLGDILNLIGAILESLLPTTIVLSVYFIFCDIVMLYQIYLYSNASQPMSQPLINTNNILNKDYYTIQKENKAKYKYNKSLIVACLCVISAFVLSIYLYFNCHKIPKINTLIQVSVGVLFGWTATILYWGARVPQIYKNYKRKSVEGLSISLFLFCMVGNLSFTLSVLLHPNAKNIDFIFKNLPWIMGSAGTILVDIIVFTQFYFYNNQCTPPLSAQSIL